MDITFLLNGESVELREVEPTLTLLNWLRETRGLCGTKEGCNEGDCGACTVMVSDEDGSKALNACILFMPQLQGKAIRTVEGLQAPDRSLHPVQEAMITHHGSQCGFCTPGFIMSMAVAHANGETRFDDALAGNLCRCTGYEPIVKAAQDAATAPVPEWLLQDRKTTPHHAGQDSDLSAAHWYAPTDSDALASLYAQFPEATLVAGATDVGLWVTKQLRTLDKVIFLNRCSDLQTIETTEDSITFGAGVTMDRVHEAVTHVPALSELIRRFASAQIRGAATIGGNIANGSPIGDMPPALIAANAVLTLRHGDVLRAIPIEDFFIAYGKQDRQPGEFVHSVTLPKTLDRLSVYKLSKRFDQDISAVCGAIDVSVAEGIVTSARIAFGGMAGIPKRAAAVENALVGQPWGESALVTAWDAWEEDFQPLSDMRASAEYRLNTARNMLARYLLEDLGGATNVLEVRA